MRSMIICALIFLLAGVLWGGSPGMVSNLTVPLRFDHYYDYEMVIDAVKILHRTYPELTTLDLVGKSEEGRSIFCMTVNNLQTGAALDKPAVYVDGNIHGNEIQATEVALYLLNYLLTQYGKNQEITSLVDRNCFYVVPMVNPDGRYHFFADPNSPNDNRGLRIPHDDDHDGLVDEDFPDDLDGDGNICMMRKRDPFGNLKSDPEDPRLMKRIKPGEKGEWRLLGEEGIDNDGDGRINEDSEGYVDPNRNWGYDWMPPYVQAGSGNYPFSGAGIKALAEYIQKRPNICVAWSFHNYGGMFLRGPSTKHQPEYPPQDIAVYDYLGEQAERITPGYRYLLSWKDLYTTHGDSGEWMTMIMGAYTFVGELYMSEQESFQSIKERETAASGEDREFSFGPNTAFDRERLKFNDHLTQGMLYKPWKPFKHPVYGDIEIGGWVKMSSRLPHPFMLPDLVHRNASAVIFSAKHTPEVRLEVSEIKSLGPGLTRIRTRLINPRAIPTMSYQAQMNRIYPKDMLTVSGKNIQVIAGGEIRDYHRDEVEYKAHRPEIQFLFVPGFGKTDHQFLVSGSGSLTIAYESRHGGKLKKTVTLK